MGYGPAWGEMDLLHFVWFPELETQLMWDLRKKLMKLMEMSIYQHAMYLLKCALLLWLKVPPNHSYMHNHTQDYMWYSNTSSNQGPALGTCI